MGDISRLKAYHKELGPLRFWSLLIATILFILLWVGADIWLSGKIGWPDSYGFHCSRRCLIENAIHSPQLLRGGSVYELALFAHIWTMPAALAGIALWTVVKRVRRNSGRPKE